MMLGISSSSTKTFRSSAVLQSSAYPAFGVDSATSGLKERRDASVVRMCSGFWTTNPAVSTGSTHAPRRRASATISTAKSKSTPPNQVCGGIVIATRSPAKGPLIGATSAPCVDRPGHEATPEAEPPGARGWCRRLRWRAVDRRGQLGSAQTSARDPDAEPSLIPRPAERGRRPRGGNPERDHHVARRQKPGGQLDTAYLRFAVGTECPLGDRRPVDEHLHWEHRDVLAHHAVRDQKRCGRGAFDSLIELQRDLGLRALGPATVVVG